MDKIYLDCSPLRSPERYAPAGSRARIGEPAFLKEIALHLGNQYIPPGIGRFIVLPSRMARHKGFLVRAEAAEHEIKTKRALKMKGFSVNL